MPADKTDRPLFGNGDRFTGSTVKKDEKTLAIKSEVFGLITLPWNQVQTLTADEPVNVVLWSGETLRGALSAQEEKVEIDMSDTKREVALGEITTLRDHAEQQAYERLVEPGRGGVVGRYGRFRVRRHPGKRQNANSDDRL